jgi:hypothetical protein
LNLPVDAVGSQRNMAEYSQVLKEIFQIMMQFVFWGKFVD